MLKLKRTMAVMMAAVFCLFALPQVMAADDETYALQGTMGSLIEIMAGSGTWNGSDTTGQLNIQLRDPADGTIFTAYKLLNIQKAADSSMLEVSVPDEMQSFWNLYVTGSETGTDVAINQIKAKMNITTDTSADTAAADIVNKFVTWSAGKTLTGKSESTLDGTNAKITAEFGFYAILQTGAPAGSYIASAPVLACLPMQNEVDAWISSYTVVPKDKEITVTKTVKAYGDADYLDKTTTGMDDTVNFQIVADLPKYGADILAGTIEYMLEDILPSPFSFTDAVTNNLKVEVSADGATYGTLEDTKYTFADTGSGWSLTLKDYGTNFSGQYTSIRIQFDAPWLDDKSATVEDVGNTNKAKLTFTSGVNDQKTSIEDTATVFTKRLNVNKVDADDNNIFLPSAEFEVYTSNAADAKPLKFLAGTSEGITPDSKNVYWVSHDQTETAVDCVTTVKVSDDGKLRLEGLNDTTYYLKEVKAPEGYNLPKTLFDVTVATDTDNQSKTITNSKGIILPITGGMGTVLFTAIGLLLMVGAAYFLFRNKKQSN